MSLRNRPLPALLAICMGLSVTPLGLLGCTTTQSLGMAPSDNLLANDGTPAKQEELRQTYAVVYEEGRFRHPNVPRETVWGDRNGDPGNSDVAHSYLDTAPEAEEIMSRPLPALSDTMGGFSGAVFAAATGMGLGLAAGTATATPAAVALTLEGKPADAMMGAATGFVGGGLLGLTLAGAFAIGHVFVVDPVLETLAEGDYRDAASAYNKDLERRIEVAAVPRREEERSAVAGLVETDRPTSRPDSDVVEVVSAERPGTSPDEVAALERSADHDGGPGTQD